MRKLLILALLCIGCGKKEPERVIIEIKSDNPILEAMGEDAAELAKLTAELEQEHDRLSKEENQMDFDGTSVKYRDAIQAHYDAFRKWEADRQDDPIGATREYLAKVKGKKLSELASPR